MMMYKDLIKDPIGEMQKMYSYFNITFTKDSEQGLNAYLEGDAERRRKFGVHTKHDMEHFGITHEMLESEFTVYHEFISKYTNDVL